MHVDDIPTIQRLAAQRKSLLHEAELLNMQINGTNPPDPHKAICYFNGQRFDFEGDDALVLINNAHDIVNGRIKEVEQRLTSFGVSFT